MAIITNKIKKLVIQDIINDDSDNYYYIGIGRSQSWDNDSDTAPTVVSSSEEAQGFRHNLQSIILIGDTSFVVPRYNWSSGTIYSAYSDDLTGYPAQPYYVLNDNNQVYMCLQQSKSVTGVAQTSTVQPTGNTTGTPFETADGYMWKFLYSIGPLDANKFIAANYIPVKIVESTDSNSPAADIEQETVQNNAIVGQISGYEIESGGNGYSSTPNGTVVGNGTDAKLNLTISAGVVTVAEVVDSSGTLAFGSGYDYATVTVSGGGSPTKPAKIRPIITSDKSPSGLGGDPRDDLMATSIMFNAQPTGAQDSDFLIDQDFRQVGILKNPFTEDSSVAGTAFQAATGLALKKLNLSSGIGDFSKDDLITGDASGAKAYVDDVNTSGNYLLIHQNEVTGFTNFDSDANETITSNTGGASVGQLSTVDNGEIDRYSGEVLYVDNRTASSRTSITTNDIKLVITI